MKLLYVDDEPDIREVAAMALEMDGSIEVRQAPSGAAALSELDSWTPDVILLDVMMPEMDGPATLAEIRKRAELAATRVIFITARAQAQDKARLMGLGAAGVITKPFDPMTLAQDVRSILAAA